ncbi:carbamoyltransferase C-terminal domain-containing protein [Micromonospora sp. WMMD975]|uniref:carbamoyltransferase family protein n=1 Tax=Micromonospora sp. WMMD975 TaxID=3016087 RepID=UPI00249A6C34|nr:carbamoyltransferase C-terminal domain-containing protein [Micromonospora sp. WMMD975]WFE36544.1 carbamoyltransferase C-terminal domain-containing protein [Micromonospora sp. WMMD975]
MSLVLGLNLSHDRSACLVRDGEIAVAVEEERLDRIKHSEGFLVQGHFERITKTLPMKAVAYCLDAVGAGIDDVDLVVGNRPLGDGAVRRILRELPIKDKTKVRALPLPGHHRAHAAVAYYPSGYDEAAVLVVDQAGARFPDSTIEKHTLFRGTGDRLEPVAACRYPADYSDLSLGLFYDFFTTRLGFVTRYGTPDFGVFGCGGYPEAGKTMGLAPYGRPRPDWGDWLTFDGFDIRSAQKDLEDIWQRLLAEEGAGYDPADPLRWQSPFAEDVAYHVQAELERAMLHLAGVAHELTGSDHLCMAGGVMLNSVANERVRAESPFREVFIPPAAGDSGVAIGAALHGSVELLGTRRPAVMRTASFGRAYTRDEVLDALRTVVDHTGVELTWREAGPRDVAELLAAHRVVGWFSGGSEIGPRALGNRSMLADPRHPAMRDYLNTVVKHREPFRPYAPSALVEHADSWFDFTGESPFMLLVPQVSAAHRESVPSITHVDGTARLQTVSAADNPAYHAVISAFHELTGVPIVLNTSYNDAGEPIVETPLHALCTFVRTELDHLYLDGILVTKSGRELGASHPARTPLTGDNAR